MKLEGFKVLVTGGSRGIGQGIVRELASRGATVAFTYTSKPDLAESLVKELGGNHFAVSMNVADEASVEQGFNQVLERFGGEIHGVVNNAGITRDQLMLRMKTQDFDDVIHTNLRGSFIVTRLALKPMMKARRGSLVHISSVIGTTGNAGQANYAASKGGLEAFSKSIALEVASRNIRSNCVAPGFIATEMTDVLTEDQKKKILDQVPLQKIGDTADVANAVCFLLSEESKYVTGQTIHVNGGLSM
jgi:3-oxoacyl-[acyl-carrier protein] reductase